MLPFATTSPSFAPRRPPRGLSLVELILFIVVVSAALAGVLSVFLPATAASADPMLRRQALAIAESLLEEVQLMPFTWCDPDDPNAAAATGAAGCTGGALGPNDESLLPLGPETALSVGGAEGRYAAPQFDNVSDYNGFNSATEVPPGLKDITGAALAGLGAYAATITVAETALGAIPPADSLRITVTVTGPANTTVVLQGFRTRYAPNTLP